MKELKRILLSPLWLCMLVILVVCHTGLYIYNQIVFTGGSLSTYAKETERLHEALVPLSANEGLMFLEEEKAGNILWDGTEILKLGRTFRKELGYMPQSQGYYPKMSAREFLFNMGELKSISRKEVGREAERMLSLVGLRKVADKKLGQYSGGMRQRALLACAMLGSPDLLILDEPTAGVDPKERIRIRGIISQLAKEKIVLVATHVVTDVECIANQVLLMKKGKLIRAGSPEELIASIAGKVAEKKCTPEEIVMYQKQYGFGSLYQRQDGQVLRLVGDRLPDEFGIVTEEVGLEEVYLYYCAGRGTAR